MTELLRVRDVTVSYPTEHGVFTAVNEYLKRADYELVAAGPFMQWCIRRMKAP